MCNLFGSFAGVFYTVVAINTSDRLLYVHRYAARFIDNGYGAGSGQIWLDDVQCSGTESSITDCQHNGWGNHNCTHSEDVSVSCIAGIVTNSS